MFAEKKFKEINAVQDF